MRDLIFVSLEDWDEIWRRNQFLCSGLAQRFPTSKFLFCGPPRSLPHALRGGDLAALRRRATQSVPGFPNIHVVHPFNLLPNSLPGGRRLNEALMRFQVNAQALRLGIKNPILWLNPYDAGHMAGRMNERGVIYDITDDWILAAESEAERVFIEAQDTFLCRAADLVIVCSQALENSRRALCRDLLLLPNGVDVEHYQAPQKPEKPQWPAPVLGYTGTLHRERVDADLIVALARAFPSGSVVLVGPDSLDAESRQRLKAEDNIYVPGEVAYKCIPETMAQFDVCIVPHRESSFTESLNPIKLWEYLAFGKPIVSTNVAGFRDFTPLCRIASGPDAFISACHDALNEDASNQDKMKIARREEAAKHGWESRIDTLLSTLRCNGLI